MSKRKKNMDKLADNKRSRLLANPWVAGISLVLALVSITLALYFGLISSAKRDLILTQEKPSILVFDPEATNAFDLTPKSLLWWRSGIDPLSEKVYVVSFAIWNNGRLSIKPEDILRALYIEIGDEVKQPIAIWEVRFSAWSREEVDLRINGHVDEKNELPQIPIDFQILEQGDGGSFQVIYSGPEDINISLRGTVEGIARNTFFPKRKLNWSVIGMAIWLLSIALFGFWGLIWRKGRIKTMDILLVTGLLIMAVYLIFAQRSKITVLVDMPIFEYRPSIEDLRD